MFGQKFTNTNEMLQYRLWHYADFDHPKSGQLNTGKERTHGWRINSCDIRGKLHCMHTLLLTCSLRLLACCRTQQAVHEGTGAAQLRYNGNKTERITTANGHLLVNTVDIYYYYTNYFQIWKNWLSGVHIYDVEWQKPKSVCNYLGTDFSVGSFWISSYINSNLIRIGHLTLAWMPVLVFSASIYGLSSNTSFTSL
jgi:hypothetical protein